jgi:glyoxylase-like metal-dependent hydrolase (beta-lactamase superfamily II)
MAVGDERNFVYLLVDERSGEAMAIDSGWEVDPILAVVREERLDVKFAVATHHHSDHAATLWQLARFLDAKVVAYKGSPLSCDLSVADGDVLRVGGIKAKVLHTPGHTEDSICVFDGENLFTGDTLLIGGCGRTDLLGGSPRKMYRSLHSVILKLPPKTMVYPGHDFGEVPSRRLSEEAKLNPALKANSFTELVRAARQRTNG